MSAFFILLLAHSQDIAMRYISTLDDELRLLLIHCSLKKSFNTTSSSLPLVDDPVDVE